MSCGLEREDVLVERHAQARPVDGVLVPRDSEGTGPRRSNSRDWTQVGGVCRSGRPEIAAKQLRGSKVVCTAQGPLFDPLRSGGRDDLFRVLLDARISSGQPQWPLIV